MSKFVTCEPRGVSRGLDRDGCRNTPADHHQFPDQQDAPLVKAWRCELTALSQRHNIYFVACNDIINVFRPDFPDQAIPSEPSLVLHPPTLQCPQPSSIHHGIDIEDPHSINRLLVDYLGNDEILLVACDDGDVVGYRIEEIQQALESRSVRSPHHDFAEDVRVFLHRNVGASAWGIAVHREARMIAFSANTFKITVIAFALVSKRDEARASPESDFPATPPALEDDEEIPDFPTRRQQEQVIVVSANTNVPLIAFNNTGKDPDGRWLFSSCIDGKTMLFDLHSQKLSSVLQLGWCVSAKHPDRSPLSDNVRCKCEDRFNVVHAAWGAMFLDTHPAQDLSVEELDLKRQNKPPFFEEADKQKKRFNLMEDYNPNDDMAHSDPGTPLSITDKSEEGDSISEASDDGATDSSANASGEPMDSDSAEEEESSDDDQIPGNHQAGGAGALLALHHFNNPSIGYVQSYLVRRKRHPYCDIKDMPMVENSDHHLPCIVITKDDIFLIQRCSPSESGCPPDPTYPYLVTAMRQPLHPGTRHSDLESHDRLCFSTQIPELGIFIIASPVGRAAIFSLTRYRQSQNEGQSTYGLKMEYMLPFIKDEEEEVWCPASVHARLAGIAVSPIQGMLDKRAGLLNNDDDANGYDARAYGEGRWRLMMYYTDHTVVSYEIARKRKDNEIGLVDIVV